MTKREFYERYKENPDITIDDIVDLINDVELYDDVEIRGWGCFCDWVDQEISDRLTSDRWTDVRDFLNNLPDYGGYFLFYDGYFEYVVDDSDCASILDHIEHRLEQYCADWLDDVAEPEIDMEELKMTLLCS